MRLRNRLRAIRHEKQLTQKALAEAVGITRQTAIAIEKGTHAPSVRLALELAQTLDVRLEDIFWLEIEHEEER
jgi:putative transcriptional regulator